MKAKKFVDEALLSCKIECNSELLSSALFCKGVILVQQQDYLNAEKCFLQSYHLSVRRKDERYQLDNLVYLMKVSLAMKKQLSTINYLKLAERLTENGSDFKLELVKVYDQLSSYYMSIRSFERAAFYYNKCKILRDDVYSEKHTTNLMRTVAENIERENNAKIESQARILALNGEVIARQRYLNVVVGLVALLFVILTAVLVRGNKEKGRINQLLEWKVKQRTRELELNHIAVLKASEDRESLVRKAASDILGSVATIRGLCLVGEKDISDATEYFEKVNMTAENFSLIASRLLCKERADMLRL